MVHIHVSAVEPMPSRLYHRFIVRNIVYRINKPCVFLVLPYKKCMRLSLSMLGSHIRLSPLDLGKMYIKLFKLQLQLFVSLLFIKYLCLLLTKFFCYFNHQRCETERKLETLLSLVQSDAPESGIIFVAEQVC